MSEGTLQPASGGHSLPDAAAASAVIAGEKLERGSSLWKDAWIRLRKNVVAVASLLLLLLICVFCIAGPWLSPYDANVQDLFGGAEPPSFAHPFGTDTLGRDLLVRVMEGGRISLMVGLVATTVSLLIGVIFGATAGYLGGKTDAAMMRFVDLLYAVPFTIFVILLMVAFGRSLWLMFIAIGCVEWLSMARIVRSGVIGLKKQEFVEAAVSLGYSHKRIIFRHLIPNVLGQVIVVATLTVPAVMLLEAFLSFLGLGVQPPDASWGVLINEGQQNMEIFPWLLIFPASFFALTLFCLNFLGDGLRDALDPQEREGLTPAMALLEVQGLTTHFHTRDGIVRAVEDVSFSVDRGETLGIVGESGSGKSVTCYSLMRLIPEPPGRIESGTALFDGQDLLKMDRHGLRKIRGARISMIFQDAMTSLNPYLRISTQLVEPLRLHREIGHKAALAKAIEALEEVGIPEASKRVHSYPHEFSGGMLQRVMIAMALITEPDLLIADEPTTALDVTVQAQILELIRKRQEDLGTAMILVSHDLGVIAGTCDKVNVMYAGRVVESGTAEQVFYEARHPYTRSLQKTIPSLQRKGHRLYTITGLPPDLGKPIEGCAFYPRCPYPKLAEPGGPAPELVEFETGHCFADCRFCDSGTPIETVMPATDVDEGAAA